MNLDPEDVAARVTERTATRLLFLLLTNTVVAILVGLLVANTVQPGRWVHLALQGQALAQRPFDPVRDLLDKIPSNLVDPFQRNRCCSLTHV